MDTRPSEGGRFGKAPATLGRVVKRPSSTFEITGPLLPNQEPRGDMLQCVHGGEHWIVRPGSGMQRGFCFNCNGPTCGSQKCDQCVPFEKAMELAEGRDPTKNQF